MFYHKNTIQSSHYRYTTCKCILLPFIETYVSTHYDDNMEIRCLINAHVGVLVDAMHFTLVGIPLKMIRYVGFIFVQISLKIDQNLNIAESEAGLNISKIGIKRLQIVVTSHIVVHSSQKVDQNPKVAQCGNESVCSELSLVYMPVLFWVTFVIQYIL